MRAFRGQPPPPARRASRVPGGRLDRSTPILREYVQALDRGFAVIRAFSTDTPALTIAEVAQRTGLTRAAARRYLLTLRTMGYVHQDRDAFTLTARLLDVGFAYLSSLSLPAVAQPFMENLVDQLHESCSVSVLDSPDIIYVARMPAKRIMSINLVVGSRLPAHATSMGKILLAHLPVDELDAFFTTSPLRALTKRTICDEVALRKVLQRVREQGWAMADSEAEEGVRSVAAPITGRGGDVSAAINVSAHASRVSMTELRQVVLPVLFNTAARISRVLGTPGT